MPPHFRLTQLKESITNLTTAFTELKASQDLYHESFLQTIEILKIEFRALRNPSENPLLPKHFPPQPETNSTITIQETHPQQHQTTTPRRALKGKATHLISPPISPFTTRQNPHIPPTPTLPNLPSPAKPKIHFRNPPILLTHVLHIRVTSVADDDLLIRDEVQICMTIERVTDHGVPNLLVALPPSAISPPEPPDLGAVRRLHHRRFPSQPFISNSSPSYPFSPKPPNIRHHHQCSCRLCRIDSEYSLQLPTRPIEAPNGVVVPPPACVPPLLQPLTTQGGSQGPLPTIGSSLNPSSCTVLEVDESGTMGGMEMQKLGQLLDLIGLA